MNKSSGRIFILVTGAVLMAYTMFRSVHLVQSTLPPGSQVMGYAALFGLDAALLAWTLFKTQTARGNTQHAVATFMIILQLLRIGATLVADTWLVADPETAPSTIRIVALWLVPIIITVNVAAITAVHLTDPTAEIRNAQRDLQDEIERQVAEQIRQQRGQIASSVSPTAARKYADDLLAQFTSALGGGEQQAQQMMVMASEEGGPLAEPKSRGRTQ